MLDNLSFHTAHLSDWEQLSELLRRAGLPLQGIRDHSNHFVLAESNGVLVGSAGLEIYGPYSVLRSVAVDERFRSRGLGASLVNRQLDYALVAGVRQVYLLTDTAASYYLRFGFYKISRSQAPEPIKASAEFQGACPESAVLMKLDLHAAE